MRRLLIALAVLIALTALAAGVDTRQEAQEPPPSAQTGPAGEPPDTLSEELSADAAQPAKVTAQVGDQVTLEVSSRELDSVEIQGLDRIEAVDPDSPARFEIYADTPGRYPITLLEAGKRVGTLTVE